MDDDDDDAEEEEEEEEEGEKRMTRKPYQEEPACNYRSSLFTAVFRL